MKIVSMINVKGGVGKTMTALNLAGAMAKLNYKVLLIDNDSQSSLTQILNPASLTHSVYNLYTNNLISIYDYLQQIRNYIWLIPNTIEASVLEQSLSNKISRENILKKKLSQLRINAFDYVIIDNSPFMGLCTQNALVASDYYLEIIDSSASALEGLILVERIVDEIKSGLNTELKRLGILRNMFDRQTVFCKKFQEFLREEYKQYLLPTVIYRSVKYKEATACNMLIQEYMPTMGLDYDTLLMDIRRKENEHGI